MVWLALLGGAALGALGARRNRARFADERWLWTAGGAVGALAAMAEGGAAAAAAGARVSPGAWLALGLWATGSLLASLLTPPLDAGKGGAAWLASAALKALQCPLATLFGLAVGAARRPRRLLLRRGTCFAITGEGGWAVTLGAVVVAQRGMLDREGRLPDAIAHHESYHARTAAALGEGGFYATYLTLGVLRALQCRAPWNGLARDGRGNPFERTAHAVGREVGALAAATRSPGRP